MKYLSNPDMLLGLMRQMLSGMEVTLPLFFYTLIFSLPLGVIVALMRMCKLKIVSVPTRVCILVLRGTPLILQIFAIYFILPRLLGHPFDRMASAVVAFVINYAAYFAEIFRGGLQSIPRGQREAGKALGFSPGARFSSASCCRSCSSARSCPYPTRWSPWSRIRRWLPASPCAICITMPKRPRRPPVRCCRCFWRARSIC